MTLATVAARDIRPGDIVSDFIFDWRVTEIVTAGRRITITGDVVSPLRKFDTSDGRPVVATYSDTTKVRIDR